MTDILFIVIVLFAVIETLNVFTLYFKPDTRRGNGIGVFNAYKKSKADPEVHELVKYLINWVAGTKIIFICLLIVILILGNVTIRIFSIIALILSILTFYWRLYPSIRNLDKIGHITPKDYSKTLRFMIAGFIAIFTVTLIIYLMFFHWI